ncbi:hypothetical protein Mgra_00002446 [Meloidogyne graminicola]|uniref:Uncharacterized protein n=1 Tax=Meloidogyne graminicola TaxID=189291 RepID=A0A8S9Z6H7_9BILA|nr:hypothetical protein Mgra_00009933 [Meloidogyne graminicola]KAF7638216.1 hypothetical protein Mgra_00002446 [Meloidogyne graminicola]
MVSIELVWLLMSKKLGKDFSLDVGSLLRNMAVTGGCGLCLEHVTIWYMIGLKKNMRDVCVRRITKGF